MKKKSWARLYYNFLVNFDKGIVLTFTETGFAWSMLVVSVAASYLRYHSEPEAFKRSVAWIITTWPFSVSIMSMGLSILLDIYPKEGVIPSIRLISGIFLVSGFIIMAWAMNHTVGYGLFVFMFIAIPVAVKVLSNFPKKEK